MNISKYNTAYQKTRILKPVVDHWNEAVNDSWQIVPAYEGCKDTIHITRKGDRMLRGLHGSLAREIAGICEPYGWSWAIYYDQEEGLYMHI